MGWYIDMVEQKMTEEAKVKLQKNRVFHTLKQQPFDVTRYVAEENLLAALRMGLITYVQFIKMWDEVPKK